MVIMLCKDRQAFRLMFQTQRFFRPHSVRRLLIWAVLAASAAPVMATLGQAPSMPLVTQAPSASSPAPGARLLLALPAGRSGAYAIHESVLDTGTTVTELATPSGVVFAVAWRGPVLPDLNALLGEYFKTFRQEAQQARAAGRRGSPVAVDADGLVVRSNGRMRNFFGSAYAPGLVPADVNIKDALQ